MVWCVANKEGTIFLTFDENDEPQLTKKYVESCAFDSPCEAKEWANKPIQAFNQSLIEPKCSDRLYAQLR
jgi:hypothetical protein|tara:strand:+ start:51193 stop:51402 length:210 start_codon:yes stop_codon:yes gene_type:complete